MSGLTHKSCKFYTSLLRNERLSARKRVEHPLPRSACARRENLFVYAWSDRKVNQVGHASEGGKVNQVGQRAESSFLIHKTRACTKHKQRWRKKLEQLEFYNSLFSALKAHSKLLFACNDLAASSMYIIICYLNVVWCIWTNFCDVLFMNRLASQSTKQLAKV